MSPIQFLALATIALPRRSRPKFFPAKAGLVDDALRAPLPKLLPFELQASLPKGLVADDRPIKIGAELIIFQDTSIWAGVTIICLARPGAPVIGAGFLGYDEELLQKAGHGSFFNQSGSASFPSFSSFLNIIGIEKCIGSPFGPPRFTSFGSILAPKTV